jgi:hypothetical protein
MNKNYEKYMPKKEPKKLVQANIDASLHEEMVSILEAHDLSWTEFVTAMCLKFLDDNKKTGEK